MKKRNFLSAHYVRLGDVYKRQVYHKALCYCLGISDDTRRNVDSIYDFKTGCVKTLLDGGRRRTKNLYGVVKRTVPAGQVRQ